jgi:hypothetical protein
MESQGCFRSDRCYCQDAKKKNYPMHGHSHLSMSHPRLFPRAPPALGYGCPRLMAINVEEPITSSKAGGLIGNRQRRF